MCGWLRTQNETFVSITRTMDPTRAAGDIRGRPVQVAERAAGTNYSRYASAALQSTSRKARVLYPGDRHRREWRHRRAIRQSTAPRASLEASSRRGDCGAGQGRQTGAVLRAWTLPIPDLSRDARRVWDQRAVSRRAGQDGSSNAHRSLANVRRDYRRSLPRRMRQVLECRTGLRRRSARPPAGRVGRDHRLRHSRLAAPPGQAARG